MEPTPNNTIKDIKAFKQLLNFLPLYGVVYGSQITDGDILLRLLNGIPVIVEVKKETENHCVENIINSEQWATLRAISNENVYLIYATHNTEISDNLIDTGFLTVQYIEQNGKVIEFDKDITLFKYLNRLSSIGKYCIKVKYPTGNSEVALLSPNEADKWTTTQFISNRCSFDSEEDCLIYIKKRYEKEFNQSYIYTIYKIESMNTNPTIVHRYTYEETIGL